MQRDLSRIIIICFTKFKTLIFIASIFYSMVLFIKMLVRIYGIFFLLKFSIIQKREIDSLEST